MIIIKENKCVIYYNISLRDKLSKNSLKNQREHMLDYASSNDLDTEAVFYEIYNNLLHRNREFKKMLNYIDSNKVNYIVIDKLKNLSIKNYIHLKNISNSTNVKLKIIKDSKNMTFYYETISYIILKSIAISEKIYSKQIKSINK